MSRYGLTPFEARSLDFFNDFFNLDDRASQENPFSKLHVDLEEQDDKYVLSADLPGFSKDDISIELDGDMLTIEAHKDDAKEEAGKNYIYKERRSGSFTRRFDVSGIRADAIEGGFKNGVLTLDLPKKQENVKTTRKIELAGEDE